MSCKRSRTACWGRRFWQFPPSSIQDTWRYWTWGIYLSLDLVQSYRQSRNVHELCTDYCNWKRSTCGAREGRSLVPSYVYRQYQRLQNQRDGGYSFPRTREVCWDSTSCDQSCRWERAPVRGYSNPSFRPTNGSCAFCAFVRPFYRNNLFERKIKCVIHKSCLPPWLLLPLNSTLFMIL